MAHPKPPTYYFDIETGGLKANQSSIYSISWAKGQETPTTRFAEPTMGTKISRWAENKIWEPVKRLGKARTTEKAVLMDFLTVLEGAPEGTRLIGWNIGYSTFQQGQTKSGGFDIPFLISRAKEYGLEDRYRKAFRKTKIRDEGAFWAYRFAQAADERGKQMVAAGLMHEDVYKEAVGYMKQARKLAYEGGLQTEREIARELSMEGKWFAGWKQESTFKLLFGHTAEGQELLKRAHESEADVKMARMITQSGVSDISDDLLKRWGTETLENKIVSSLKAVGRTGGPSRYLEAMATAREWGVEKGVSSKLRELAQASEVSWNAIEAGQGVVQKSRIVRSGMVSQALEQAGRGRIAGVIEAVTPFAARHLGKISLGVGAIALVATKPGSWFSGKDDAYNVIEGLPHGGQAERMRHMLTDFGSGYLRRTISKGALELTSEGSVQGISQKMFNWLITDGITTKSQSFGFVTGIRGQLKDIKGSKQFLKKHDLWEEAQNVRAVLKEAEKEEGFQRITFYNPSLTTQQELNETILHERVHQFLPGELVGKLRRASKSIAKQQKIGNQWFGRKDSLLEEASAYLAEGTQQTGVLKTLQEKHSILLGEANRAARKRQLQWETGADYDNSFSAFDDAYNTIEGLRHEGMAGPLRRDNSNFGSGYTGLLTVPKLLSKVFGKVRKTGLEAGVEFSHESLRQTLSAMRGSLGEGATKAQTLALAKLEREAGIAAKEGFLSVAVINPEAVRYAAKQAGVSQHTMKAATIKHERLHQTVTHTGLRKGLEKTEMTPELLPFLQGRGEVYVKQGQTGALVEEFIASSVEASVLKRAGATSEALEDLYRQTDVAQKFVSRLPTLKPRHMIEGASKFRKDIFRKEFIEGYPSMHIKDWEAVAKKKLQQAEMMKQPLSVSKITERPLSAVFGEITAKTPPKLPRQKVGTPPPLPTSNTISSNIGAGATASRKKIDTEWESPVNLNKAVSKAAKMFKSTPKSVASQQKSSILDTGRIAAKRKQKMQTYHRKAQVQHSSNSLRPGKRHRHQTGRIIN